MVLFTLAGALRSGRKGLKMMIPGPPEGEIYAALRNQTSTHIFDKLLYPDLVMREMECSLCNRDQEWLFIAATGRSGSTTTLNMLQSIPGIYLAGENSGVMAELLELYDKAPSGTGSRRGAWAHGPVSETSVLCALQDYVKALIGKSTQAVTKRIGFKEVRWSKETLDFMLKLFPCAQIVVQTRTELKQQKQSAWYQGDETAQVVLEKDTDLLETWQRNHTDQTFPMHLEDFSPDRFNTLLRWLGVQGCQFKNVCHANDSKLHPRGYNDASSDVQVDGTCSFAT